MVVDGHRRWWGLLLCVLLAACSVEPGSGPSAAAPSETPGWHEARPESEGFDPLLLTAVLDDLRATDSAVHEIVVARDAAVVLDAVGYPYDGTTPHQVGEITEAVVTTLLGIAVDRGLLALDDPVVSFFGDRAAVRRDGAWPRMTVRHLASMTSGLACGAGDDAATLAAMEASPDWVDFTLGLPVTTEPGTTFSGCRPAAHLLAAVLQRVTGVSVLEFARQFLFDPLGITNVDWMTDPGGIQRGWSDLYLRPRDLARIGVMWLDGGSWDGRRIVSEGWQQLTSSERVMTGAPEDYGFGWWLSHVGAVRTVEAHGRAGQLLHLRPDDGLVIVTAGSGLDTSHVVGPVAAALVSPDVPLLTDDLGHAGLAIAADHLRDGPQATTPSSPLATVRAISKVEWTIEANPIGLDMLVLDLKGKRLEGSVTLGFADAPGEQVDPIGLDGRFRIGPDRYWRPIAIRGSWAAGRTFVLEVDEVTAGRAYTLRLEFAPDARTVTIEGRERGHDTGFVAEGRAAD